MDDIDADIIAFQEMETWGGSDDDSNSLARPFLLEQFPDYSAAAIGPWQSFPSTQPIFYRHQQLDLIDQGFFMFGPTPDVPYSETFNGDWSAFASWAQFEGYEPDELPGCFTPHLFGGATNTDLCDAVNRLFGQV